jgi:hypothetical protein
MSGLSHAHSSEHGHGRGERKAAAPEGALHPATGWLLSSMVEGAAMALSPVTVVLNALRLNRVKP